MLKNIMMVITILLYESINGNLPDTIPMKWLETYPMLESELSQEIKLDEEDIPQELDLDELDEEFQSENQTNEYSDETVYDSSDQLFSYIKSAFIAYGEDEVDSWIETYKLENMEDITFTRLKMIECIYDFTGTLGVQIINNKSLDELKVAGTGEQLSIYDQKAFSFCIGQGMISDTFLEENLQEEPSQPEIENAGKTLIEYCKRRLDQHLDPKLLNIDIEKQKMSYVEMAQIMNFMELELAKLTFDSNDFELPLFVQKEQINEELLNMLRTPRYSEMSTAGGGFFWRLLLGSAPSLYKNMSLEDSRTEDEEHFWNILQGIQKAQVLRDEGESDFIHMTATMKVNLLSDNSTEGMELMKNCLVGWAGDMKTFYKIYAEYIDDNNISNESDAVAWLKEYLATEKNTPYGRADFWADIDAINLGELLQEKNLLFSEAILWYYGSEEQSSKQTFLEVYGGKEKFETLVKLFLDYDELGDDQFDSMGIPSNGFKGLMSYIDSSWGIPKTDLEVSKWFRRYYISLYES